MSQVEKLITCRRMNELAYALWTRSVVKALWPTERHYCNIYLAVQQAMVISIHPYIQKSGYVSHSSGKLTSVHPGEWPKQSLIKPKCKAHGFNEAVHASL